MSPPRAPCVAREEGKKGGTGHVARGISFHAVACGLRAFESFHHEFPPEFSLPPPPFPSAIHPAPRATSGNWTKLPATADYLFIPGHVIETVMVHFEEFSCRAFANYPSLFPYYSQLNYFWLSHRWNSETSRTWTEILLSLSLNWMI